MNASEVIRMGRSRCRAASRTASNGRSPSRHLSSELDDEDGVLPEQADEHDQRDVRVDVVLEARELQEPERSEDPRRQRQDDRRGQEEALVLRGEDEVDEDERDEPDDEPLVAIRN